MASRWKVWLNPAALVGTLLGLAGGAGFSLFFLLSENIWCERNCGDLDVVYAPAWATRPIQWAFTAFIAAIFLMLLGDKFKSRDLRKTGERFGTGLLTGGIAGGVATPILFMIMVAVVFIHHVVITIF